MKITSVNIFGRNRQVIVGRSLVCLAVLTCGGIQAAHADTYGWLFNGGAGGGGGTTITTGPGGSYGLVANGPNTGYSSIPIPGLSSSAAGYILALANGGSSLVGTGLVEGINASVWDLTTNTSVDNFAAEAVVPTGYTITYTQTWSAAAVAAAGFTYNTQTGQITSTGPACNARVDFGLNGGATPGSLMVPGDADVPSGHLQANSPVNNVPGLATYLPASTTTTDQYGSTGTLNTYAVHNRGAVQVYYGGTFEWGSNLDTVDGQQTYVCNQTLEGIRNNVFVSGPVADLMGWFSNTQASASGQGSMAEATILMNCSASIGL